MLLVGAVDRTADNGLADSSTAPQIPRLPWVMPGRVTSRIRRSESQPSNVLHAYVPGEAGITWLVLPRGPAESLSVVHAWVNGDCLVGTRSRGRDHARRRIAAAGYDGAYRWHACYAHDTQYSMHLHRHG